MKLASILVVTGMLFWWFLHWQAKTWDQALVLPMDEQRPVIEKPETQMNHGVAITNVPLPDVPKVTNKTEHTKPSKTISKVSAETLAPPKLNEANTSSLALSKLRKSEMVDRLKHIGFRDVANTEVSKPPRPKSVNSPSEISSNLKVKKDVRTFNKKQSTAQIYNELSDKKNLSLEIALPEGVRNRDETFDYLYQCAGVQFALLKGRELTYLSTNKRIVPSQYLRRPQGTLDHRELRWLSKHQGSGVPVRVFPKQMDWQLSNYIARSLRGESLRAFQASYKLRANGLYLVDIKLNGQNIHESWLILQRLCSV